MNGFEVVAFVLDAPERIIRFVEYYRTQGAFQITLYVDAEQASWPNEIAGATTIHCGQAFWSELGITRPHLLEDRQRAVYAMHYKTSVSEWMLVVDCDEFVFGDVPIPDFLARVPAGVRAVRIGTAEAVFAPQDNVDVEHSSTLFRLPSKRWVSPVVARLVYGDLAPLFSRSLLGHAIGKQFVRTGLASLSIGIHHAHQNGRLLHPLEVSHRHNDYHMYLGHFDVAGFEQWRSKWDRRTQAKDVAEMGRKRERQRDLYVDAKKEGTMTQKQLFRRLYALTPFQIAMLGRAGLLIKKNIFQNIP